MSHPFRTGALALLVFITACDDATRPVAPDRPDLSRGSVWQEPPDPVRARDQRLARRVALAMADPAFRAEVHGAIQGSRLREQRVLLQRFLYANGQRGVARVARATAEPEAATRSDLAAAGSMEMYFPVPEHRARWRGGAEILVATSRSDGEIPVAFDPQGRKHLLDPARPPSTPVLAVQFWEGADDPPCAASCVLGIEIDDGTIGGTFPPPSPTPENGLFLTGSRFFDTFESWLKGAPEFEIHVLGHKTGTTELMSYQCIGERAGGPYTWNQDQLTWTGSAMVFSRAQFTSFEANHPGQGLRLLVLEDDDGPCSIRVDKDRVSNLFKLLDAVFKGMTSGERVTVTGIQERFQRAYSIYQLVSGLASFFATNDDLVGTAIEDPAAAGLVLTGAQWVVKGTNNVTNGALRLQMR